MTVTDILYKTKCDFIGCKNLASAVITSNVDPKKNMCFCKECMLGIYKAVAKNTTPKGVEAPFKKNKK